MKINKFRAWNKKTKEWELSTNVHIELDGNIVHVNCPIAENNLNCDCLEITEFTGSKDINNKDIYEGDIILSKRVNLHHPIQKGEVIFENACFKAKYTYNLSNIPLEILMESHLTKDEVVGNIYKNPELLKEES